MSIRDWPQDERPREKLLRRGPSQLSDAELLAVFAGSGGRGEDAVSRGRRWLSGSGSLAALLQALRHGLPTAVAIPTVTRCRLLAAMELAERVLQQRAERGEGIADPALAGQLFRHRLRDRPAEVFAVAFLDSRHRLIAFEELFQGGIDGAEVHPREVVRRCLRHNAAAVLFGHNHPSGVPEPSQADRRITEQLRQALALIDVRVLDHLVVGDGAPVSLAQRGWL